ncbi:MAG TPA: EamA family transporter [Acidimicrobiales bacterium]|nr:EamA family transporter [Acidimicrobiales bacterium]
MTGRIRRLLLLAFIWGWSFLFIKVSVEGMSPPTVACARVGLGALVLLLALRTSGRSLPRDRTMWRHFAVAALFGNVLPFTLLAWGEERITSALTSVLNASTPLFTAVVAALVLKDRLKPVQLTGLLLGFGGVAVAAGFGAGDLGHSSVVGSLAAVVASAFYGIAFVYMRRNLTGIEPIVAAGGQLVMATLLSLPFAIATSTSTGVHLTVRRALAISALGVIGTGAAYILNYGIIREVGAIRPSIVTYIIPVVAVAVGIVVLEEQFQWRVVWGGVLIIAGIALLRERRALRLPVPSSAALLLVLVVLVTPLVACGGGTSSASCSAARPEALNPALNHVFAGAPEPTYTTDPPTSGPHTPGALPAGVLTTPLSRPNQVGALEGGVVLLQYRNLSGGEVADLSQLVTGKVVVAPNPSLPDRVVATAWLFKQTCSGVDAAELRGFIRTHVGRGPGTDG